MKTITISRAEAVNLNMSAESTIGIVSENCLGVWGEGSTKETATADAEKQSAGFSPDGCWFVAVE